MEYAVYVDGWFVGCVVESCDEHARCAAISQFSIPAWSEFEVFEV